jgi:hypothetical protein
MKSLKLYQEQYALFMKEQQKVLEDMSQLLAEGREDGFKPMDIMDPPKASPEAPSMSFDL